MRLLVFFLLLLKFLCLLLVCLMNVSQDLKCTECLMRKKEEGAERTTCLKPTRWQQPEQRHWGTAVGHSCGPTAVPQQGLLSLCSLGILSLWEHCFEVYFVLYGSNEIHWN